MRVRVISDFGLSDGAGHRYRTGEVAVLDDELAAAWLAEGYVEEVEEGAVHSFDEFGRILGAEVGYDPASRARVPADQLPPEGTARPPAAGAGATRAAWAAYAEAIGVPVASDASRADIIAAVDGHGDHGDEDDGDDAAAGQS